MSRFMLVCLVLGAAAGCSDPTKGIVTGTVTINGEPAETGYIGFIPADGRGSVEGAKIVDGAYTATVPVGMTKVQIRVPIVVGEKKLYNTPDSPVSPLMEESLPPKFNDETELTYEVPSGKSEKNFDLTAKIKVRRSN